MSEQPFMASMPTTDPKSSRSSMPKWVIPVVMVVVIAAISFALGIMLGRSPSIPPATQVPVAVVPEATEPTQPGEVTEETTPSEEETEGTTIAWIPYSQQQIVPFNPALKIAIEEGIRADADAQAREVRDRSSIDWWRDEVLKSSTYAAYELGTVRGGKYDGARLALDVYTGIAELGPFPSYHYYLFEREGQPTVYLASVSEPLTTGFPQISLEDYPDILVDASFHPAGLRPPAEVGIEGNMFREMTTLFGFMNVGLRASTEDIVRYQKMPAVGSVPGLGLLREYVRPDDVPDGIEGAFFVLGPDGRRSWYDLEIPFWKTVEDQDSSYGVPDILWTVGGDAKGRVQNNETYVKGYLGGCGVSSVVYERKWEDLGELVVIGDYADPNATNGRGMIYGPASYKSEDLQTKFENWKYTRENGTHEDFVESHPVFYWQDGLGRWLEFTNSSAAPVAECGKPVIYLYPEMTTDMTVQLAPQGGFTKSEPAYGEGWQVTAHPDGSLVNSADGKTYPYLFWEGRGGLYAPPSKYWVVARRDVHGFLVETLAKFGLNAQETADFMEFWEPRMQSAAYYQIGFHGTKVMDRLAPLSFSQKPDTVLRILMDYQELSAPIDSAPPLLPPTPARAGFTVIEWGGVLR